MISGRRHHKRTSYRGKGRKLTLGLCAPYNIQYIMHVRDLQYSYVHSCPDRLEAYSSAD
jgi:hypothetical protein